MSRHSRIHILNEVMNSVERYWRFFFHWLLDVSCIEHRRCFNVVVRVVESNAKTLREATHMNCHTKKKVDSPALLKFFKRAPAKKFAVEFKPIKKKPKQIELRAKVRPKPLRLPQISQPSALPITSKDVPPPPPKRLRSTCLSTWDLRHYVAPESIISSRLDKRSPEFRVARVWYIRKLKEDGFPMLNMSVHFAANESSLGVKLRIFHQWFREYEDDLQKIAKNAKPKPKKPRHQKKVVCQAERKRWTATQKLDFLREWDRMRAENPSLTQKEFCELRPKLNKGTFSKMLPPMSRKRIGIDARNPQLKHSRWSRNRWYVKVSNVKNVTIHLPASNGII